MDSLASQRIPPILAVEVDGPRPSSTAYDFPQLIAALARANVTWGEERIAALNCA